MRLTATGCLSCFTFTTLTSIANENTLSAVHHTCAQPYCTSQTFGLPGIEDFISSGAYYGITPILVSIRRSGCIASNLLRHIVPEQLKESRVEGGFIVSGSFTARCHMVSHWQPHLHICLAERTALASPQLMEQSQLWSADLEKFHLTI